MKKNLFLAILLVASLTTIGLSQQSGPGYLDPQRPVTGTLSVVCSGGTCPANSTVQVASASGLGVCSVVATPSNNFTGTMQFEQGNDGNNWQASYVTSSNGGSPVTGATGAFIGSTPLLAILYFRVRLAVMGSGTVSVIVYCVPARVSMLSAGPFAGGKTSPTATPIPNPLTATLGGTGANLAGLTGCMQIAGGVMSVASPNPNPTVSPLPIVPCDPLLTANFVNIMTYGYQPQNPSTFPAAFAAAVTAAGSMQGGGRVLMPGAGTAPTLTDPSPLPLNVVIQGTGSAYGSQFNVAGVLTIGERGGLINVNVVAKNGPGGSSDCGITYAGTTIFEQDKFVLQNSCTNPLLGPGGQNKSPVFILNNSFTVTCTGCQNNVLLQVSGVASNSAGHTACAVVENNMFSDQQTTGIGSTQAMQIYGTTNIPSNCVAVTGNAETGQHLTIPDLLASYAGYGTPSPGKLTQVNYSGNSIQNAPTLTDLDSTSFVGSNTLGNNLFSGSIAGRSSNACSATSGVPCGFTWSVSSFSSGIGTTTAQVPASSVCTATPTQTPILSSTDINACWVTGPSTNTLTIHVQDLLGTASTTYGGNGICA